MKEKRREGRKERGREKMEGEQVEEEERWELTGVDCRAGGRRSGVYWLHCVVSFLYSSSLLISVVVDVVRGRRVDSALQARVPHGQFPQQQQYSQIKLS